MFSLKFKSRPVGYICRCWYWLLQARRTCPQPFFFLFLFTCLCHLRLEEIRAAMTWRLQTDRHVNISDLPELLAISLVRHWMIQFSHVTIGLTSCHGQWSLLNEPPATSHHDIHDYENRNVEQENSTCKRKSEYNAQ